MAKITSNTQIDTINILTEVNSANDTDLILLQRGLVSHKMKKQNLIIPSSQIAPINTNKVLGNIGVSSAAPSEVTVLDSTDDSSNSDAALVTEKRIKDYINNKLDEDVNTHYVSVVGTIFVTDPSRATHNNPPASVATYAQAILPNLPSGDKVLVNWGAQLTHWNNSTSYRQVSFVTMYNVISSSNWEPINTTPFN